MHYGRGRVLASRRWSEEGTLADKEEVMGSCRQHLPTSEATRFLIASFARFTLRNLGSSGLLSALPTSLERVLIARSPSPPALYCLRRSMAVSMRAGEVFTTTSASC